mgnify:CR=1 FL=1
MTCQVANLHESVAASRKGRLTSKDCGGAEVGVNDAEAGEAEEAEEAARKVACPFFFFLAFSFSPEVSDKIEPSKSFIMLMGLNHI